MYVYIVYNLMSQFLVCVRRFSRSGNSEWINIYSFQTGRPRRYIYDFTISLWISMGLLFSCWFLEHCLLLMYACYKCLLMYMSSSVKERCRYRTILILPICETFSNSNDHFSTRIRILYISVDLLCTPNKSMTSNQN